MPDHSVLLCGEPFKPLDRFALDLPWPLVVVDRPADIPRLELSTRSTIKAMGHRGKHGVSAQTFDWLPELKLIANFGAGYDDIDIKAANARGIKITNTPDVLSDDVADLAVAMLLALTRDLVPGDHLVRSGRWSSGQTLPFNRSVLGKRVGICGLGRIGREIALRLQAFKMEVHYHSRTEKVAPGWTFHPDPISLAQAVDFYVIALIGGDDTLNYVSREAIAALRSDSVIVNVSRGSVIDEDALIASLETKQIAGAALDVFQNEPSIDRRFLQLENVLLQPHHASSTVESREKMAKLQFANIRAFMEGRALLTPVT